MQKEIIAVTSTEKSTRETLLDAAVELMSVKGYHGMSMSDIEKATGLGRSSIYHHVASKEALLAEICDASTRRQADIAKRIVAEQVNAEAALYELVKALLWEIINFRERALVSLREINFLKGDYRKAVLKNRQEYESYWATVLNRAVEQKIIKSCSDFDLNAMLGMINYSAVWLGNAPKMSLENMADRFTNLILNGLR